MAFVGSDRRGATMRGARARTPVAVALLAAALLAAGCGDGDDSDDREGEPAPTTTAPVVDPGDDGEYDPLVEPTEFVAAIDNAYLPLVPGARWVYEGESDGEPKQIEVVVTDETRGVMGVTTTVVRHTVRSGGQVAEVTDDWYAQDREGNVWYFGEDSKDYMDGEVASTEGSWEAGIDGALPGMVMRATPMVADAYRQQYLPGEAEGMAEVLRTYATLVVPFGAFDRVVVTEEWSPLEPETIEHKYYAPGVGLLREETVEGGEGFAELVEHTPAG